jgi:hypothetical protein
LTDGRFDGVVRGSRSGLASNIRASKGVLAYECFKYHLEYLNKYYHDPGCNCGRSNVSASVPDSLIINARRYGPGTYPIRTVDGYVVAYIDGCCLDNGRPNARAGLGVWFGEDNIM